MDKKKLRIVFMGTPDFAVTTLDTLFTNGYNIVGVVTVPDKPSGRGKKIQESAVKSFAKKHHLNLLQPDNLKDEGFVNNLKQLQPDLQIVVAFRKLPEIVWSLPKYGTFNLHASLLPQYRGAAPINWAIINGETTTGVTTFFINDIIDSGNIIFYDKVDILPSDTFGELHDKLMKVGAGIVVKTINAISSNTINPIKQETYNILNKNIKIAPKIFKADCRINWAKSSSDIFNFIRGLSPYPTAFMELLSPTSEKYTLKVFGGHVVNEETLYVPGSINTNGKTFLNVSCSDGWISIDHLQLMGKKDMNIDQFLRGFPIMNQWKAL